MQFNEFFGDDEAVSPVIGVILMVAITVILAAVIATFVLGLGEQVSDTAPTASFTTEYSNINGNEGNLTVTHDGGDSIKAANLFVRGQNGSNGVINQNWTFIASGNVATIPRTSGSNSTEIQGDPAVSAGDFIRQPVQSDAELRIIFDSQQGDQTATLATFQGPDA